MATLLSAMPAQQPPGGPNSRRVLSSSYKTMDAAKAYVPSNMQGHGTPLSAVAPGGPLLQIEAPPLQADSSTAAAGGGGGVRFTNQGEEVEAPGASPSRPGPSGRDVAAAARRLNIDLVFDADLLGVAEEFLKVALPQGWEEFYDDEARAYYHHAESGTTQWAHPLEEYYRGVVFMRKEGDVHLEQKAKDSPPTPEEVREMAKYFGIQARDEVELMDVAKAAVNAPLPPEWEEYEDDDGEVYFYNKLTKKTSEHHPLDGYFLELVRQRRVELLKRTKEDRNYKLSDYDLFDESFVPLPWMEFTDPKTGKHYYYDFTTSETCYQHPSELIRAKLRLLAVVRMQACCRGNMVRAANKKLVEYLAATAIQRNFRGYRARKGVAKSISRPLDDAATKIQAVFRGKASRTTIKRSKEETSALLIQAYWRGAISRKRLREQHEPNLKGFGGRAVAPLPMDLVAAMDMFAAMIPDREEAVSLTVV